MKTIHSILFAKSEDKMSSDGPEPRWRIAPGLLLAATIAVTSLLFRKWSGVNTLSPLILSFVIGIIINNVFGTPIIAISGVVFSAKTLLRIAIVLLGFQLTIVQLIQVGALGLVVIVITTIATFVVTQWFGRVLGIERKLVQLIAAGTSICGASAIVAVNTAIGASKEDVAYSIACITMYGSLLMLVYPIVLPFLSLTPFDYGLWAGASIHEIAQVVGATFQQGEASAEMGTVTKLSRVMLLAPMMIAIGIFGNQKSGTAKGGEPLHRPVPWIVMAFVLVVVFNSVVSVPFDVREGIVILTTVMFSMALGALGLQTDLLKVGARGLRPFILGAASSLFIASLSFGLIQVLILLQK